MIPSPLLDDIINRKCLPVIGAGFSKNVDLDNGKKMPDWNQLANTIGKKLNTSLTNPMEIMQEFEKIFGRSKLIEEVEQCIPIKGAVLGEVHKYFVKISPFDLIYTTNFDLFLEDAFRQETKRDCKSIVGEKQLALFAHPPTVNIVKMHGDLQHQEYLILTKKDYDEYMEKYPAIATHLSANLITRTPLFIGYSLTDPNFRQIRQIIQNRLGDFMRRGYIVLFDATQQEIEEYDKLHLSVINLQLNNKSHSEVLLDFLKEICTYVTTNSVKISSQSDSHLEELAEKGEAYATANMTSTDENLLSIIRSVTETELVLRNELEKRGIKGKDLKKSLTGLGSMGFKLGLLSSGDLGLINDIMGVRNEVVHSGKNISDDQAKWIMNTTEEIRKKIATTEKITVEEISIEVHADQLRYTDGSIITITGKVKHVVKNAPMTIQILDPEGTLVKVIQSDIEKNGMFVSTTKAIGPLWEIEGDYTVIAQYVLATTIAKTKFSFKHRISRTTDAFPVWYNDKFFEIKYSIRGGKLRSIDVDHDSNTLHVFIESNQDGDIALMIPRNLIDAKLYNEEDDRFLVMIDGAEVSYTESKIGDSRNLTVKFLKGDATVEIIGNRLRPLERIFISSLTILDEKKNPTIEYVINKPFFISGTLLNNQEHEQKYAFIIQIMKDGITVDNLWINGILSARMYDEPKVVWTPKESGKFDIHAFVWENIENPKALASPKYLTINIGKPNQPMPIKRVYSADEIISNLDTIIETYSGFPPTKNQLNEAIKLYDICWQWAKEKFQSKYEINILKTKPVSVIRLFAAPNPASELRATKDELIIKAQRLKKIISQAHD